MHQEAVSLAGRHGDKLQHQEKRISDLQEALDTLILQNTPKEEEEVDYFSEPKKAMEQFITPKLKEIEEKLDRNEKLSAVQQLYAKHPDAADVVKSSEFQEWIQAESSRRYAFENAQSGNLSAADSILSDFKRAKKPKQDRKSETQKASTGVTTASTAPTSRKIYKRRDIIDLMKKDPKRYESMAKEIRQAYAEGRVR